MRRTSFSKWPCSIARTTDVLGDWWTPLVLREVFFGTVRFDDLQRALSIGRNVLTDRLRRLTREGLLERRPYQERPPRYEYHLTEKGRDFYPVLLAMMRWGDRWLHGRSGPPILLRHDACGALTHGELVCAHCRAPLRHEGTSAELPDGRSPNLELRAAAVRRVRRTPRT
jgi:DNA-binding HxlR family transcriptional regulator